MFILLAVTLTRSFACVAAEPAAKRSRDIPVAVLQDKIRGGLLAHLLGDLDGLKHEMKYIAEPGGVAEYSPSPVEGARPDNDTEWVYIVAMQRRGVTMIPAKDIPALWQERINRLFWCADQHARQPMDLGMEPPGSSSSSKLNPWAVQMGLPAEPIHYATS